MSFVVDCSFSSALFLPDEGSDHAHDFFLKLKSDEPVFVPHLWWYETGKVLNVSVKRKRLNYSDCLSVLNLIGALPLVTDSEYGFDFTEELFKLSQLYKISSYDAAYLELSIRKEAILMTLDDEMREVAKTCGIECG